MEDYWGATADRLGWFSSVVPAGACSGPSEATGDREARSIANPDGVSGEFAIVVADEWQHKGIGSRFMGVLIETAQRRGFKRMEGKMPTENLSACSNWSKSLGLGSRRTPILRISR